MDCAKSKDQGYGSFLTMALFRCRKLILFDLKNKKHCIKLKKDHQYGSSLIFARDQQTECRLVLLPKIEL